MAVELRRQLDEATREIAYYQRLSRETGTRRLREAEELSALIAELRTTKNDLVRANDELERRVAERTVDLLEANRALRQEIAERKQTEDALRESEERFRSLFASVGSVAVQGYDPDGTIHYWNRSSETLYGYTTAEALGRNIVDLIVPDEHRKDVADAIRQMAKTGQPVPPAELELRRKDGTRVLVYSSQTLVTIPGRGPELFCIDIDISSRKKAEEEKLELERRLLHTQKLESLGVLAGGIAHDFNNLLLAILGNLDVALRTLEPKSPARENIEHALKATNRSADLTRQILAYSGKGRFVVKVLDLSELVTENADLLRATIPKNVTLRINARNGLPLVEGDRAQLQQVVMNLITNASDAIGQDAGTITITTGIDYFDDAFLHQNRLVEPPPAGNFVFLEVVDTGCGMDQETLRRLFDPFFTTKEMGRGLGMSAILGIVRGHGGAIHVNSVVGMGTSIRVLIPPKAQPQHEKGLVEAASAAGGALHAPDPHRAVLVVDDEEIVREVCSSMVAALGMRVLTASSGQEALDIVREKGGDIGCVILDLSMPDMGGLATFSELKRIDAGLQIILSSGFHEVEAFSRFSGDAPAGFIQKPYSLEDLRSILVRTLQACPHDGT
jgi:PAS domain S-box-containing protein